MAENNLPSSATAGGDAPALVVGLGASEGGIEALSTFFANVPPDTPFAYIVILHLSPDHEGKLAEMDGTAVMVVEDDGIGFDASDRLRANAALAWSGCGNGGPSLEPTFTSSRLQARARRSFSGTTSGLHERRSRDDSH